MQIKNIKIFDSTVAADGAWIDVSNLVALSIQINNIEGNVWMEVSNDPNVNFDGAAIGPPASGPTCTSVPTTPQFQQGTAVVAQPITATSISTNVLTVTVANSFTPGQSVVLSGTAESFLNGQAVTISTIVGGGTGFTAAFTHADYTNASDSGQAALGTQYFVKTTLITPWGETTASPETAVTILPSQVLRVAAPTITATQKLTAIGYNVYVGKTSGSEVLQTMPQFAAQRVIDTGGIHWATAGAIPLTANGSPVPYIMDSFFNSTVAPPLSDNSGGVNVGIKIPTSGTFVGSSTSEELAIFITGSNVMVNPSCLAWKWLRIRKDATAQTLETVAWLMGQNG